MITMLGVLPRRAFPTGALPTDIMRAFSTKDRPVTIKEFFDFWESLTYEEQNYYRFSVDITLMVYA